MNLLINENLENRTPHPYYNNQIENYPISFEQYNLQENKVLEKRKPNGNLIIIVLSGKISISSGEYINKFVSAGDMAFLPPSSQYKLSGLESSVLMNCEIPTKTRIKANKWFETLSLHCKKRNSISINLPIKQGIKQFIDIFQNNSRQPRIGSPEIQEWKQEGFLLLLKSSYSPKELAEFFSPVLGCNMEFKEFIYFNIDSVKCLQDFADLAKCSLTFFCREFKKNFGESAYQWLLKRKSQLVLHDIENTAIPFQELADKYGFSSQPHFTRFIKQWYNDTPKEIRSRKQIIGK